MATLVQRALNVGVYIGLSTANRVLYVGSGNLVANSANLTFDGTNLTIGGAVLPLSNDVGALGSTSLKWSDLFLASGAVLNFNSGDVIITHSAGALLVNGTTLIQLRDAGISLGSSVDGTLDIIADTILNLGSSVTTLNVGNTAVTTANFVTGATTTNVGQAGDIVIGSLGNKVGFYGNAGALKSSAYTP